MKSTTPSKGQRLVVTVRGAVQPAELGVTLSHDHILIDYDVPQSFAGVDYAAILDNENLATEEVSAYSAAGGMTICDPTNIGIGRRPNALKKISEATGVHVVMGSGWYRERVYPPYIFQETVDSLASRLVREIKEGVEDSGIRPGFIGEIGTERHYITPAQERVFRAAARAHRRTGCPIMTHTTHWGELALEQLNLLEEEGVDPQRVIISHLGDRPKLAGLVPIAKRGPWLSIDNLAAFGSYLPLEVRADNVASLWQAGFGDQIMLSNDVCLLDHLKFYGGGGYANVITNFLPLLRQRGITDEQIHTMTVRNPSKAFSYVPVD